MALLLFIEMYLELLVLFRIALCKGLRNYPYYAIIRGILEGVDTHLDINYSFIPQNIFRLGNLFDWNLLVYFFDLDTLFSTVVAEAKINRCS